MGSVSWCAMEPPAASRPLVSIVVPVFNAGPYLDQALDSLTGQTYENLEIICLNDGSTDDSLAIMERCAAEDGRMRIIDKANEGYGATCNRGIDEAHGDWIAILEPDDWLLPGAIAAMVNAAEKAARAIDGPNASASVPAIPDLVKTPYWRVLFPDTPKQTLVHCYYKGAAAPANATALPDGWLAQGSPAIASCTALMEYHPSIWSALYRADFLREHGIRFLPIPGAGWADNPFLVETMAAARSIVYLDTPFYCYREETPTHFEETIRRQPTLVFDRWHDGTDVLEHHPDLDDHVVQAHYHRGFNNRDKAAAILGETSPLVQGETIRMFGRMKPALVLSDPALSPAQKVLFAHATGRSDYRPTFVDKLAFKVRALGRQARNLRTVGLKGARAVARWRQA